jgi:polysaccharide chain length determinant protein (PEP-CTERM system associated)
MNKETLGVRVSGLEFYSLRDYRKLLWSRKWLIVFVTLAVACMVSFAAYRMPSLYEAKTTIMVDPGKVPDSYVKSTATIDASERLALLQEQILSTTRLSQVIDELHLYEDSKQTLSRGEIVARMRKDVVVNAAAAVAPGKDLRAFEISYTSQNPALAARVADRLASLFIEQNMKVREQQVLGTVDFFDHELETAKQDLDQKGQKLAHLKAQYFAELPEAQAWHAQALTSLQIEMRSEMDAISAAQQQKVYLESILADTPSVSNLDSGAGASSELDGQLERLQEEMDQLRARYGPSYPDVVAKAADIDKLQKQLKQQSSAGVIAKTSSNPVRKHHNPVIESQIAQIDNEIQERRARETKLKDQIAYHEGVLEKAPGAEQELTTATNDYNYAADHFKRLEDHKFSADMSSDVETRQKGERFIVLEPAQTPTRPASPNRPLLDAVGLVGGFVLALGTVLALEVADRTIKTQRELAERLKAPIFGEIPWRATKRAHRRGWAISVIGFAANSVLAFAYSGLLLKALR